MTRLLIATCLVACSSPSKIPPPTPTPPTPVADPAPPPAAPVTTKRVVVSLSRKSGTSVVTVGTDGTATTTLDVLENGRGPHSDATIKLAPDGTIASLTAKGHHTFGATYEATFQRTGDHVAWKSSEETGERDVHGPAFYLPTAEIPETYGWLVAAAIKNGGSIPVLPNGSAHVEKNAEVTVTANGATRTVVGYALSGLELMPMQTWMNPDGTWFGMATEWFSVVPEGWESAIEPLIVKRRELIRARDAKLAASLAQKPPPEGLVLENARVLDVERGRWDAGRTVVIVGDKIVSVDVAKRAKIPNGAKHIDLQGKALLPGMVDMHAHTGNADGILNLASGVTTARDVGNDPDHLDDFKQRYDDGTAIGPHLYRFGFIEGRGEKAASSKVTAETPDEAKAAVKFFVDRHYDGIKIYNSVKPELVPVIAQAAHAAGKQVTGHIPVHMLAHEAIDAGYDGIEHVNMLFLNFFATHDTDTRDTTRFTLVGEKAPDFDLNGQPMRAFTKQLLAHKTVIDPTVNAFEDLLVGEQGKVIPGLEGMVTRLPVQAQRDYLLGGLPIDADKHARYLKAYDKLLAMVKTLYDAKVRLVIGTDALAGLMYHHELALFARAGLPNAAILKMATIDAARYLGGDNKWGSIAPGKVADLVVVDGDPLANIADIAHTVMTVRAGVVFDTAALYQAVGVEPAKR